MESDVYDVTVIGSGPGGYVAAIKGSQLGLRVALVEKYAKFGGTCLHWGCIPTKAFLFSAEVYENSLQGKEYGVICKDINLDFRLVKARKDKLVKKLSMGIDFLLKKNKVSTFRGIARLDEPGVVIVEGDSQVQIRSRNIIIATGSESRLLPGLPVDSPSLLTNREILDLENVPRSLLVIGGGALGIEFASIFARFGSDVTVLEMLPRILPQEDHEVSEELNRILTKKRIKILTNIRINEIKSMDGSAEVLLSEATGESKRLAAEKILLAVGRRPMTEGLGLDRLRVAMSRDFISVDANMQTSIPGIFAIGDVVATPALAHVASHEGIQAMRYIAGEKPVPINYDLVPSCVFCRPEVASVGLTENAARERGFDVVTSKFPFAAIGKAGILGESEGFVKLVSERKYKQILGMHIIGPHATELISEGTSLIGLEATAGELAHLIHPHPTVSEGIMEAAHALYSGMAIHI